MLVLDQKQDRKAEGISDKWTNNSCQPKIDRIVSLEKFWSRY